MVSALDLHSHHGMIVARFESLLEINYLDEQVCHRDDEFEDTIQLYTLPAVDGPIRVVLYRAGKAESVLSALVKVGEVECGRGESRFSDVNETAILGLRLNSVVNRISLYVDRVDFATFIAIAV